MKKITKEHGLVKLVLGMLLFVIILTWIIPAGSFATGAEFSNDSLQRIGLLHVVYGLIYAMQNFSIQIVFILFVGMFYAVVRHVDGYKKLVHTFAKLGKDKDVLFAVITALIIALLSSVLTNGYIVLVFIPFIIHVLREKGFNKLSLFITTFGAMLVGTLGATYGSEGLSSFLTYISYGGMDLEITSNILIRFGVLLLAFIVYAFFLVRYLKANKPKKDEELIAKDVFALEEVKNKKAKVWPIAIILCLMLILAILGFMNWEALNVECFEDFHTWFMGLAIGKVNIFEVLLGENLSIMGYDLTSAFGSWYLFSYTAVLGVMTIIIAFMSKIKFNDCLTYLGEGIKKLVKPVGLLVLAYTVFVFIYWSPIIPTIINFIGNLTDTFNPFVHTLQATVGSIFNSDLGYLTYNLSYYLANYTAEQGNIILLIYVTIYGLVSFITPISMFLLFGLSYLNVPYKKWFKYIWKFVVIMLVLLVAIFALLTYL